MKKIATYNYFGQNAIGGSSYTQRTAYRVEPKDVGTEKKHYLGYNHKTYRFTTGDVGRFIENINTGYQSWDFCSKEWVIQRVGESAAKEME